MTLYRLSDEFSGETIGHFEGESERAVLDALARNAGFLDYDEWFVKQPLIQLALRLTVASEDELEEPERVEPVGLCVNPKKNR